MATVVGLSALGALTLAVLRHPAPFGVDARMVSWSVHHRADVLTSTTAVTDFGTWPALLPLLAASWVPFLRRGDLRRVAVVAGGGALTIWGRWALAQAVARPRPPHLDRAVTAVGGSFPSGHTTAAAVAAVATVLVIWPYADRGTRVAIGGLWAVLAVAVGASRVVLGVHWPTDVLGGWAMALAYGGLTALVTRTPTRSRRRDRREPEPATPPMSATAQVRRACSSSTVNR